MKKSFSLTLALTLVLLTLLCFLLTGCGSKEAGPSPEPTQSAQSGENIDSKKIEPTEEPTAEPEPTPEETYYGFELDGEARYICVSFSTLDDIYFGLYVDDPELVRQWQDILEKSSFRMLSESETSIFKENVSIGGLVSFSFADECGRRIGCIGFIRDFLFNSSNEIIGYKFFDNTEWITAIYQSEDGEEHIERFAVTNCDDFIQLRDAVYEAALAGYTCEEYYNLYMSGQKTNVKRRSDMNFQPGNVACELTIFEHQGE